LVVLAGIVYRFANPEFVNTSWHPTSALLVATAVFAFFVASVGFCAFLYPKSGLLMMFEGLLFLSLLMSLAIGIYAIIAGSSNKYNNSLF
jgi:hypothetical protein